MSENTSQTNEHDIGVTASITERQIEIARIEKWHWATAIFVNLTWASTIVAVVWIIVRYTK